MNRQKREAIGTHHFSDRLKRKLSLIDASQAAVIEAPSGYGKSTAIRDFFENEDKRGDSIHWFNAVEEAPMALYRRLCAEIERIDPHVGKRLLDIDFPNAFTIGEACGALRSIECSSRTWLLIDDFHFLFTVLPPSLLAAMLDHGRENFHIVIMTQPLGQDFLAIITGRGIPHITVSDLQWEARDIRRYFKLSGLEISPEVAKEVMKYTDGWVIAVHLQLCSYRETGVFSDKAIILLMENLIWNKMTSRQQEFFLRMSVFETCSLKRMRSLLKCDILPDYSSECLTIPFIR